MLAHLYALVILPCCFLAPEGQAPYFGAPLAIPGTVQAQWYDTGGEGVAYHDCDSANNGGAFRTEESVDLAASNEGSYYLGWLCAGEWLEYSIESTEATTYRVEARVASAQSGGAFRLDFFNPGGKLVARSPIVGVPATGDWEQWQSVTTTVKLPAGRLQMRLVNTATSAAYNVTYLRFLPAPPLDPKQEGRTDQRGIGAAQRSADRRALVNPVHWELVWSDEFDVAGAPDPTKWRNEVGYRIRNKEQQYYTPGDNAVVKDGNLVIEARKEAYPLPDGGHAEYTAASMSPRTSWLYGRVEVRAKLPTGRGMWPAIWMLGDNIGQVGWPASGEIDIMENVGYDPLTVHGSVHTTTYHHTIGTQQTSTVRLDAPHENFHVYAIEWYPDRIDFFVDRVKYLTFLNQGTGRDAWPFDGAHFLKLNIAVGGMWGGVAGIDDSIFPQRFYIDHVRAYRRRAD